MSKNLDKIDQENSKSAIKLKKKIGKKIYLSFLTICAILVLGFIFYEDYKMDLEIKKNLKSKAEKDVAKFDNISSEIFNLKNSPTDKQKSKISSQERIGFLEKEIADLQERLLEIQDRDKAQKIIISYINLRQKIFVNQKQDFAYFENLQELEFLAKDNEVLKSKITTLKLLLPNLLSREELLQKYSLIIDKIITNDNRKSSATMLQKVWYNLRGLIIVRKIDKFLENEQTIDAKISKVENALKNYQYVEAQNLLLEFDKKYDVILLNFMVDLENFLVARNTDSEILEILKKQ